MTAIFISAVSLFVAIEHGRTERALVAANWLSELTTLHPRKLAACPVSRHPFSDREPS